MAIVTASQKAAKRREVMLLWVKQLMSLHDKQGTAKAAAAGWLAAIFALRAADRVDAGAQWGRIGDEIIDDLEWGYRQALGAEAEKGIEVGHRLLETHERPHIEIRMAGGKRTDVTPSTMRALKARAEDAARKAQAPASRMQAATKRPGMGGPRFARRPGLLARKPLLLSRTAAARSVAAAKVASAKGKKAARKTGKKRA
jgi:hypothetical protein